MKKINKLILVLLIIFNLCSSNAYAQTFVDTKNHWAKNYIDNLYEKGYIFGIGNKFNPNKQMTKAEFYSLINSIMNLTKTYTVTFSDVKPSDWFYKDVAKGIKVGYIIPTTGRLEANNAISRIEVVNILGYIYNLKSNGDVNFSDLKTIPQKSKIYIKNLIDNRVITGYQDKTFKPYNKISRGEVTKIISESLRKFGKPKVKVILDSKIKFGTRN